MRKLSFLALVGTLALLAGGCGSGETETSSSPPPTIAPVTPTTPAQPSFDKPVVEGKQQPNTDTTATDKANAGPVAVAPPELIPPTDPRAQINRVQRGGKDPFALPEIQLENPPAVTPNQSQQPVPNVRNIPGTEFTPPVRVPTSAPSPRSGPAARQQPASSRARVVQARRPVIPPSVDIKSPSRPTASGPFALQPPGSGVRRTTVAQQSPSRPATPGSVSLQSPNSAIRRATGVARSPQRPQRPTSVAQQRSTTARRQTTIAQQPSRSSTPARTTTVARTPQRRTTTSATTVPARPSTPNQGSTTATNATPRTPALPVPPEPQIAILPPPPEPTLARAVEVSGVIQVGNEPQAIIKAPNESTSRYVRVGQRLSNGQVLVKRIEMNQGSEPVVVLEQYGIEVAKVVGEQPVEPAQPGTQPTTPTASVPTFS